MSEREELLWLCTEAGLEASVADQFMSEDISMELLLSSTLSERREILRAMGLRYGTILIINRALELRQKFQERAELDEEASDENNDEDVGDQDDEDEEDDDTEEADELETNAARKVVADAIEAVHSEPAANGFSNRVDDEVRMMAPPPRRRDARALGWTIGCAYCLAVACTAPCGDNASAARRGEHAERAAGVLRERARRA